MTFSELQNLFKKKFGIDHLSDIARELNVSPQAVSNWKARDSVPYKYVRKLRNQDKDYIDDSKEDLDVKFNDINSPSKISLNDKFIKNDNISITDIFLILANHLKIIFVSPIVTFLISIIYLSLYTEPIYESHAKIMSSGNNNTSSQAAGIASQFGINIPVIQSEPQWVYTEIVRSRTLARSMLKRKFDTIKYGKQKTIPEMIMYDSGNNNIDKDILIKSGIGRVLSMIDIRKNNNFYDLTISAPEAVYARDIARTLIEELDAHQRKYNKRKTSETRKFIEERIANTREELESAEENLKDFSDRNRRIENSPALQLERQRFAREVSVLTGVFTTLKQQLETTKIEEVKDSEYVIVLDPPEASMTPSRPKKRLIVSLALLLGIFIGIFFAFIKNFIDSRDKDDKEKIVYAKSLLMKNIIDLLPWNYKISSDK